MTLSPRLPSLREVRHPPHRGRTQRPGEAGSAGGRERADFMALVLQVSRAMPWRGKEPK